MSNYALKLLLILPKNINYFFKIEILCLSQPGSMSFALISNMSDDDMRLSYQNLDFLQISLWHVHILCNFGPSYLIWQSCI